MICYSCNKQKGEITLKKSSLLPGINLMLCNSCIESRFEPRWVIILAARQQGTTYVRDYIVKKRYFGADILGSDLIS